MSWLSKLRSLLTPQSPSDELLSLYEQRQKAEQEFVEHSIQLYTTCITIIAEDRLWLQYFRDQLTDEQVEKMQNRIEEMTVTARKTIDKLDITYKRNESSR